MGYLALYQRYIPNLTKDSGDQWRGNCPFHIEKTPKNKPFCVNMETSQYHCKGCPAKGNAITFAKHFGDSTYLYKNSNNLAGYQKLEIKQIVTYQKHLLDHLDLAPHFWNADIVKLLKVGWDIKKDNFVFPIFSENGDIINVKHHHGPQFKGSEAILYPLNLINRYDDSYIVIPEGEKDSISLLSNGIQAVTSTGGTTVVPRDISALLRFKKIYICLDNDPAGDTGTDLWIKKLKEMDPKCYVRVCDISDFVDEGGDVTDYFSLLWKSSESYKNEIMERSIWAKIPGSDVPSYIRNLVLSDEMETLSIRDQVVYFHLIHRATRYRVITSKINGMRVRMKPGEYITTYSKLAEKCGKGMSAKMVNTATNRLEERGLMRAENLKMKRGMKFTLVGWNEYGHSESNSESNKTGLQNIDLLSSEELIKKLINGDSE